MLCQNNGNTKVLVECVNCLKWFLVCWVVLYTLSWKRNLFSSCDWSITLNHRCPNKTSLPSLPYKYLCERERVRGAENKVQPRVFCRGRGESEVSIKVCSVKYLWVKSRFWWYQKAQWQRISFQIRRTTPQALCAANTHRKRLKQVCQEHKEPHNLCYAETQIFPQKALTIYRENEKQLDNHVITVLFESGTREEKSRYSSVHWWTEIAGWPQNEKIFYSLLQSYIQSAMRVIQRLFPTVLNGHSSNQQMCISMAVWKSNELPT